MEMSRNKYLLISPYPPPFVGGSLVYLFNMTENVPERMDILTNQLGDGWREVSKHNIIRSRFIAFPMENLTRFKLFIGFSYMLLWFFVMNLFKKYDAVVVNQQVFGNSLFFLLGKLLHVCVIGIGHGEEITIAQRQKGLKGKIKRVLMNYAYKKAGGFIVVCHFCRDLLVDVGVNSDAVEVIPSSTNPRKLHPVANRQFGKNTVISVGRLVERKGFHCLVDAIHKIKDEIPSVKAHIVGDGPMRQFLEEKVKTLRLEKHVFIHGEISDEKLSRLYQESDLFVLAHMMLEDGNTEGCPTVFSEAGGSGIPVIGGTGAGADTAIIEGETGYIVNSRNIDELADRIKKILTNPTLAEEMGKAAIEKVKRDHDPEKAGKKYFDTIHRIAIQFSSLKISTSRAN